MWSDKRGLWGLARHVFVGALLTAGLTACTPIAGGIAVVGVVTLGVLTSRCYDYVDVTVLDAAGRKTCDATVTARKGKSQFELTSCYYASLTDGRWTLQASLPGASDATTTINVEHPGDCTRSVQTVELTLHQAGSLPVAPSPTVPALQTASPPPPAAPPSAVPPPTAAPPTAAPPTTGETTPTNASPATSAAPAVGVFPNAGGPSH